MRQVRAALVLAGMFLVVVAGVHLINGDVLVGVAALVVGLPMIYFPLPQNKEDESCAD